MLGRLRLTGVTIPAAAIVGQRVPLPFRPALRLLASLDDASAATIAAALASAQEFQTVAQLQEIVPDELREQDATGTEALVPCLL
jgi:hypothetical protein